MTTENIILEGSLTAEPLFTSPPIAGFWRRFAAWFVDIFLLWLTAEILGWSLVSFWFKIGPYGRFVGLLIILSYFTILNSRIGNGQTIGKRLLKIAVRNAENNPIGTDQAFARISILAIPVILNGWQIPIFNLAIFQWLGTVIVFGVGTAIIYTMIFNRKTRQGLHDLLCGTYVVHLPGTALESFPRTPRIHWIVTATLLAVAVIGATLASIFGPSFILKTNLAPVYKLYQTLEADERFFSISVNDATFYSNGETSHTVDIRVWCKGSPSSDERIEIANDIAKTVLAKLDNVARYQFLRIMLTSAFDFGIATGYLNYNEAESINGWRQKVNLTTADSNQSEWGLSF